MGLDKTPDLAQIEERARELWASTGIYEFDPGAPELRADSRGWAGRVLGVRRADSPAGLVDEVDEGASATEIHRCRE